MNKHIAVLMMTGMLAMPGLVFSQMSPAAYGQTTQSMQRGVSAEDIERRTFLTVTRLSPMPDGGVMVTSSAEFMPDEVLVLDTRNKPVLMTMGPQGQLIPHPTRVAAVHHNDIFLIDKRISLSDLQDNLFPTVTFNEEDIPRLGMEPPSGVQARPSTPITQEDFNRPLPTASTVTGVVGALPGEIEVSFPAAAVIGLPTGWRTVRIGDSLLVVDSRGVIQNIVIGNPMPVGR